MSVHDRTYNSLLQEVLDEGTWKTNRTGIRTKAVFGTMAKFDLRQGFPLLTTKKMFWKGIVEELLWFLRGETNVRSLQEKGVHIWDSWSYEPDESKPGRHKKLHKDEEPGDVGPVYGAAWRRWWDITGFFEKDKSIYLDQITNVIETIKKDPDSRRLIVTAWDPSRIHLMGLPPCHMLFQFSVTDGELSCMMTQRSADTFLGVPFNIASYALLTHLVAHVTGLKVGILTMSFGDLHIYENHMDQVQLQLSRFPHDPPRIELDPAVQDIDGFTSESIKLVDYKYHPAIKGEVAV